MPDILSAFSRFAKTYAPGEVIFSEYEKGDTFYLIQSGEVQLVKIVNGIQKNLDILAPSEIFGEMAILENTPRSATAIAVGSVKALEFNKENFETLMTGNPAIAMKLLKLFVKRIFAQKRRFMVLTLEDPQARVGDVFLMLNETRADIAEQQTTSREFTISSEDIAQWAGMTKEAVQDELHRFLDQRKIEIFENKITVKNINDMQRFVTSRRRKL